MLAVAGIVAGAALPGAVPAKKATKEATVRLDAGVGISGRVKSRTRACKSKRTVRVIDALTGARLARVKTNPKGRFRIKGRYAGKGYASIGKKRVRGKRCKRARSPVVPLGTADLVVVMTSDPNAFHITITNNGPDDATGVILTAGQTAYIYPEPANPPSCRLGTNVDDAGTCTIASIPSGTATSVNVRQTCLAPAVVDVSAAVRSDAIDPVPTNNTAAFDNYICP